MSAKKDDGIRSSL